MQTKSNSEKTVSMLGLARRAGKTVLGTPLLCEAFRKKDGKYVKVVYIAAGASDGTKKKIRFKCEYYGVPCYLLDISTSDLGHALGKSGEIACVGVCDESFASSLKILSADADTPQISTGKDSFASAKDVNV